MRLRPNEFCPIHRSTSCCGRELMPAPRLIRLGVQRIEDPHRPRGYRELRSPAEMRKLMKRKIVEQGGICPICHEEFTDYNDIVPDHREPKAWEGRGETTTPTISKRRIGGVTKRRDQPGLTTDGPSAALFSTGLPPLQQLQCAIRVPLLRSSEARARNCIWTPPGRGAGPTCVPCMVLTSVRCNREGWKCSGATRLTPKLLPSRDNIDCTRK
jgi:hypothetical protein